MLMLCAVSPYALYFIVHLASLVLVYLQQQQPPVLDPLCEGNHHMSAVLLCSELLELLC